MPLFFSPMPNAHVYTQTFSSFTIYGKPALSCAVKPSLQNQTWQPTVLHCQSSNVLTFHSRAAQSHWLLFVSPYCCNLSDLVQFSCKTHVSFVCNSVCRVHDDAEGPAQHLQQRPAGMRVCLCLLSLHGKDFSAGRFLSDFFVMLSLLLSCLFRRIRRPCLTAMILFTLCCRCQLESCQLSRSEN